jgi:hypothetical protein
MNDQLERAAAPQSNSCEMTHIACRQTMAVESTSVADQRGCTNALH